MNVVQLKELIIENADNYIPIILENLDCTNIHIYTKEIRSSHLNHSSINGIRVSKTTLYTTSYYDNFSGDLITLIQEFKKCNFKDAIHLICQWLNIKEDIIKQNISLPFNGYFKNIKTNENTLDNAVPIYDRSILERYINMPNKRFLQDGISLETQLKYNIRYDMETDRITIVWHNSEGEIVGVTGRINESLEYITQNNVSKYLSIVPFPKSQVLYGYHQNYNYMLNNIVTVFEAEKSVLKCDTLNMYNAIAIGSHNISEKQCKLITSLYPKNVIFCYDEDVDDEIILKEECNKILENKLFNTNIKVGYVLDKDKKYLTKNSKKSPIDINLAIFKSLMKECLIWIN